MLNLIRANCRLLLQGRDLLLAHSQSSYSKADGLTFGSSIGTHMRHVLDHYSSFLDGCETGVVDYDNRERGTDVESLRAAAIAEIDRLVDALGSAEGKNDSELSVRVSSDALEAESSSRSSYARELQFLVSHTVHHFAIIAIASRMQGVPPETSFGVAPSTLKYLQTAN